MQRALRNVVFLCRGKTASEPIVAGRHKGILSVDERLAARRSHLLSSITGGLVDAASAVFELHKRTS